MRSPDPLSERPFQAPAPTSLPLTWAAAARGCARSGCERGARRCSRGRRRPGRRCRAAAAARGSWLPGRPGQGQGRARRGREAARADSAVSASAASAPGPARPSAAPAARLRPRRPRPLPGRWVLTNHVSDSSSARGARPRSAPPLLKLRPQVLIKAQERPRPQHVVFANHNSASGSDRRPRPSPPLQAPPSARKRYSERSSAHNALSLATWFLGTCLPRGSNSCWLAQLSWAPPNSISPRERSQVPSFSP